ncbi:MAG: hypothetical protein HRU38_17780 [Saccharospirillaceae bacterium]|nr:S41 family peptidase [Pseudomonadales bacterium]NRB80489.1 hypothetical protein [Saccharospirillaceae bacterium]
MFRHSTTLLITLCSMYLMSCSDNNQIVGVGQQITVFSGSSANSANTANTSSSTSCSLEEKNIRIVNLFKRDYLFNEEVQIPADYQVLESSDLVQALKVSEKERYSFWVEDAQAYDRSFSQGISSGLFGFRPMYQLSETQLPEDGRFTLYLVEINSPAHKAGLRRGDTILSIDGITSVEIFTQFSSMNDAERYEYHVQLLGLDHSKDELTIVWQSAGDVQMFEQTIIRDSYTSDVVESAKIIDNQADTKTGYLAYRSFSEFSTERLIEAFDLFDTESVDNLIFDFRSNGGGLVSLAGFIANSSLNEQNTLTGESLLNYEYNERRSGLNQTFNFANDDYDIGADKVVVLIDAGSCSASELVINMLLPYVDVTIIGDQSSCGKPYGMEPAQICDGYLFPVTLKFTNANNDADYIDGFSPDCVVKDTVEYNWGDVKDPQIDEALHILNGGNCRTTESITVSLEAKNIQKQSKIDIVSTYSDYENPNAPLFKY